MFERNLNRKMKRLGLLSLIFGTAMVFAVGCASRGPLERAGEKGDETVGEVKDAAKDAADKVKDAADDVEDNIRDATN